MVSRFIEVTTELRALIQQGSNRVFKLWFEALHELTKLPLQSTAFLSVTLSFSDVRLIQQVWRLPFVECYHVVKYGPEGI